MWGLELRARFVDVSPARALSYPDFIYVLLN
jgi:hypothetical protein